MLQLDLPLSVTFYRWLLGEESSLGLADLAHVAPDVHRTLVRLQDVVRQKHGLQTDATLATEQRNLKVGS